MTPTMLTPPIISMLEIEDALGMFMHAPKETRSPDNGKFEWSTIGATHHTTKIDIQTQKGNLHQNVWIIQMPTKTALVHHMEL